MLAVLVLQPLLHSLQAGDEAGRATGIGLRPCCGIAPWAIAPVKLDPQAQRALGDARRSRPSSGSQHDDAVDLGRQARRGAKCLAPSIMPSSSTSAPTTMRPGNGPACCTALAA